MSQSLKWKIITSIIGALSVLSPFIYSIIFNSEKGISYEILYKTAISTEQIELENLKMSIDDEYINDLFITTIKIVNSGTIPIASRDYEEPLKIVFDKNVTIYSSKIIETNPKDITLNYKIEGKNEIVISPILLNEKDYFMITTYASSSETPKIMGRIIGVKDIYEETNEINKHIIKKYMSIYSSIVVMILMGYLFATFIKLRRSLHSKSYIYLLFLFTLEYVVLKFSKTVVSFSIFSTMIIMLFFGAVGFYLKIQELKLINKIPDEE